MRKEIVILSNGGGGIATFQANLIKYCQIKNYKVHLLDKKKNNHTVGNLNIKKNLKVYVSNVLHKPFKTLKNLILLDKNKNYNFIISNPAIYVLYVLFIYFFFKKKKIYLIIHSHITKKNFIQYFISFTCSTLLIFASRVYFVSKFTKRWWCKRFFLFKLVRSRIKYNLVEIPSKKKTTLIKKNFVIGFVGRLEKEKGIEKFLYLANIFNTKLYKKFNLEFVAYGNGEYKKKIINSKNIVLKKWDQKKEFLKKINLLIVTSPIENCPFTILECKSHGVPVLNLSKGGAKEIIKNYYDGISIEENINIKKIIKSILIIKKKEKFYKNNCYKNSKKFNLNKIKYLLN